MPFLTLFHLWGESPEIQSRKGYWTGSATVLSSREPSNLHTPSRRVHAGNVSHFGRKGYTWHILQTGFPWQIESLQVGKDARLDGFFPKDSSEPWIAGESKSVASTSDLPPRISLCHVWKFAVCTGFCQSALQR